MSKEDFRSQARVRDLQKRYGGFLVLRPTFPDVLGRSHLSASVTRHPNIVTCHVSVSATVCGVKLVVTGFPHASQDQEMLTCAETTIWSLMEYFGQRYAEYRPALPNEISKVLSSISYERLIPSKGLGYNQISFAIKEFGFGVKGYTRNQYGPEFEPILQSYVESGIPVIAWLRNAKGINHVVNIIGREPFTGADIGKLGKIATLANGNVVYDFASMPFRHVTIDDNYPPYQLTYLNNPAAYYTNPDWQGCILDNFIVPLYPKIYLEASDARKWALVVLNWIPFSHKDPVVIKTFLASSRSFKNSLALNPLLGAEAKTLLLSLSMPKFVWITEITDNTLLEQHLCNGIIIIDATEPNKMSVIACLAENRFLTFSRFNIGQASLSLPAFQMFNNLKAHAHA